MFFILNFVDVVWLFVEEENLYALTSENQFRKARQTVVQVRENV